MSQSPHLSSMQKSDTSGSVTMADAVASQMQNRISFGQAAKGKGNQDVQQVTETRTVRRRVTGGSTSMVTSKQ